MEMEIVMRADNQPDVAQLPLSIFQDKMLIKTVTLTGMDKEWQTLRIPMNPAFLSNFYLKFYFAQGGLEIKSVKIFRTKDLDKEFNRGNYRVRLRQRFGVDRLRIGGVHAKI